MLLQLQKKKKEEKHTVSSGTMVKTQKENLFGRLGYFF
jgi:hypothetical protein